MWEGCNVAATIRSRLQGPAARRGGRKEDSVGSQWRLVKDTMWW